MRLKRPRPKTKRHKTIVLYRPGSVLQQAEQALREREKAKDKAFMKARRGH